MKLIAPFFFLFLFSCGTESENSNQVEISKEHSIPPEENPSLETMLNGMLAPNVTDKNGSKHGHWCLYGKDDPARGYPDHGKIEQGSYEDDKKTGIWIYYSPEGAIDSMISYDSETPEHTNSGLNKHDANGFKNGYWIVYGSYFPERGYPADAKVEEGRFKDDLKDGRWIYFGKDGEVDSAVIYENNTVTNVWMPGKKWND